MHQFRYLVGLFTVFFSLTVSANENIISGAWYKLESKILKEERQFAVYIPPSYNENNDTKYPVMYVLDGDVTRFRTITGLVEALSTNNLGRQIPEFIIVAIPNTDRNRDLTPTAVNFTFKGQLLDELDTSGGASKFASFLERELIPHMNRTYRTNDTRLLLGESFGGLFAAHSLLLNPLLFTEYLITDATYVWDNNYLNRILKESIAAKLQIKANVYLSLANNEHLGEIGKTNYQWGKEFAEHLKTLSADSLDVRSQYFEDETHGTVAMLSWYHGLLYLYKS
ncbi:MAG: putative alpha/beta superfamily hydrolase [Enterobacterales bacterium]|jgi:predicted alpha/beta superfamily hydrolase